MKIPIVVVDDDEIDRYLVQRVVKSLGIDANVVEYNDGIPFVDVISDRERISKEIGATPPPILVLLDINMPQMGGFEVLEAMEKICQGKERVMIVTMYSSSDHGKDRSDAEKYPFVHDYIVKPVTADRLQELITQIYPDVI